MKGIEEGIAREEPSRGQKEDDTQKNVRARINSDTDGGGIWLMKCFMSFWDWQPEC